MTAPSRTARIGALVALGAFLFLAFAPIAWSQSQEHIHGHTRHHDQYRFWFRPLNPSVPCCNAKEVSPDGKVSGDCYPTEAIVKDGHWYAKRDNGVWIAIGDEKIVRYQNPDPTGRDAHLCEIDGVVFCFRPPVGGT